MTRQLASRAGDPGEKGRSHNVLYTWPQKWHAITSATFPQSQTSLKSHAEACDPGCEDRGAILEVDVVPVLGADILVGKGAAGSAQGGTGSLGRHPMAGCSPGPGPQRV